MEIYSLGKRQMKCDTVESSVRYTGYSSTGSCCVHKTAVLPPPAALASPAAAAALAPFGA